MSARVKQIIEKDEKYIIHGQGYFPIVFVEGKGCILKDFTGKEYIDCISGTAGTMTIGHSNPKVVKAVKEQVEKLFHCFPSYVTLPRIELSEKLVKITPPKLNKIFFASSGSEAVETALRGAMRITEKKEVISLYNAYHGSTIAAANLGQPWLRNQISCPIVPGFKQIPPPYCYRCFYGKTYPDCDFECARALEHMIKWGTSRDVAAFIVEPIQGNGGHIFPPSKEYFNIVRETCDQFGVLLIDDEVQTGFGRTGKMWACEYFEFQPDIMCIGKAMGSGLPISATIFREDHILPNFQRGDHTWWHTFTHSGNPVVCAAASAVTDVVVEQKFPEKADKMGKFMSSRLMDLQKDQELVGEVRGPGLFIGVELVKNRETREKAADEALRVLLSCLERGVMFGLSNRPGVGNVIKIKPPIIITEDEASKAIDTLNSVLTEVTHRT